MLPQPIKSSHSTTIYIDRARFANQHQSWEGQLAPVVAEAIKAHWATGWAISHIEYDEKGVFLTFSRQAGLA